MNQTVLLILIPIVLVGFYFRIRRMTRGQKLRIERMWIIPAFFIVLIALSIGAQPPAPDPVIYASLGAATIVGLVIGWFRGRMVRITVDVETHALTSQQSPWGMVIFVAILLVRSSLRYILAQLGGELHLTAATVQAIADGSLLIYGGMMIGMRIEMWMRARKLLADARAAKAAGKTVPAEVSQDHA